MHTFNKNGIRKKNVLDKLNNKKQIDDFMKIVNNFCKEEIKKICSG